MPNTIADLLAIHHIEHTISSDDPLLKLPLTLFKEEMHADLITLMYLYNKNLIDLNKIFKPGTQLSDFSARHVQDFYESIKATAQATIDGTQKFLTPQEQVKSIKFSDKRPYNWHNANQMTLFLQSNPVYLILAEHIDCSRELYFLLKLLGDEKMDVSHELELLYNLDDYEFNNTLRARRQNLILTLAKTDPFKNHPRPGELINQYLAKLRQQQYQGTPVRLASVTMNYVQGVLTELAQRYPVTLKDLFHDVGVKIPEHLSADLTSLLSLDLRQVSGLTEDQWPELMYYGMLFMYGYAKASPSSGFYTYSDSFYNCLDSTPPSTLQSIAQNHSGNLKKHLQHHGLEQNMQVYDESLADDLRDELILHFLNQHPGVLALICFENCPPLRNLFIGIWEKAGLLDAKNTKTHALIPDSNKFLLGKILAHNNKPIAISNHDLSLIEQMMRLGEKWTALQQSRTFPYIAPEVKVPVVSQKQLQAFARLRAERGIPSRPPRFFSPSAEIILRTNSPEAQYQTEFENLKKQISDPALSDSLSLYTMERYSILNEINFNAIAEFVLEFGVDSQNSNPPSCQDLIELFKVVHSGDILDSVVDYLVLSKQFIDLDGSEPICDQITHLEQNMRMLAKEQELASRNQTDEGNIRSRWIETQLGTCLRFKEKLQAKQQELDGLQMQVEDQTATLRY